MSGLWEEENINCESRPMMVRLFVHCSIYNNICSWMYLHVFGCRHICMATSYDFTLIPGHTEGV